MLGGNPEIGVRRLCPSCGSDARSPWVYGCDGWLN
ncbi:MAG: hypothetical protein RIS71_289, partial [Actinomycetota bacterium]